MLTMCSRWRWSHDVCGTMVGVTGLLTTSGNFIIMYMTTFGPKIQEASVDGKVWLIVYECQST